MIKMSLKMDAITKKKNAENKITTTKPYIPEDEFEDYNLNKAKKCNFCMRNANEKYNVVIHTLHKEVHVCDGCKKMLQHLERFFK